MHDLRQWGWWLEEGCGTHLNLDTVMPQVNVEWHDLSLSYNTPHSITVQIHQVLINSSTFLMSIYIRSKMQANRMTVDVQRGVSHAKKETDNT